MTGTVNVNPHTPGLSVVETIDHAYFRGSHAETKCDSEFGTAVITVPGLTQAGGPLHWCIRTVAETDKFNIEPRDCGGVGGEFTFLLHVAGITCGYTRTANLSGTFTTPSDTKQPHGHSTAASPSPSTWAASCARDPENWPNLSLKCSQTQLAAHPAPGVTPRTSRTQSGSHKQ